MGEKETAGAGMAEMKQAPDKKKEDEQAQIQDVSPNSESAMRQGSASKDSIQNMR